ncbi:MAG: HigA family addiction module antitoxin [Chloroflexota bacterium]|nr:HigA family addiction module antitoxin [Dehalococcoidia bacterium]MDE2899986.1 HigA family addiction module antitoxin [Chloroflexota bacterium]
MFKIPTNREPTYPGEMLREEFLLPLGITQRELADAMHVPYQRVNEVVRGRRGLTPTTALRLSKFFGNDAGFWMNLQIRWDLYHAQRAEARRVESIRPFHTS